MPSATLEIGRDVRRAILAHARAARPRECCGLLVGRGARVLFAVPTPNRARGQSRYLVDVRVHLDLQKTLRRFVPSLHVVGAYHSHPNGPARPSPTDVREACDPAWVHLIVGLSTTRPIIRAFRVADGRPQQLRIRPG